MSNTTPAPLVPFSYESNEIRTIRQKDGSVWFVTKDVCSALTISNHKDTLNRLDDDEKDEVGISDRIGRVQKTSIINESGLYTLILRSNKPEAKPFRKWVTSEVLPSIRKTGRYIHHNCLTPAQQRQIQRLVSDKAHVMTPGKKPTRDAYMQIYRSIKDRFIVGSYKQIPAERFNELVEFLGGKPTPQFLLQPIPDPEFEAWYKKIQEEHSYYPRHTQYSKARHDKIYTEILRLNGRLIAEGLLKREGGGPEWHLNIERFLSSIALAGYQADKILGEFLEMRKEVKEAQLIKGRFRKLVEDCEL